jgi:hypothetical protein
VAPERREQRTTLPPAPTDKQRSSTVDQSLGSGQHLDDLMRNQRGWHVREHILKRLDWTTQQPAFTTSQRTRWL